jgi:hypothetical protein
MGVSMDRVRLQQSRQGPARSKPGPLAVPIVDNDPSDVISNGPPRVTGLGIRLAPVTYTCEPSRAYRARA